MQEVAIGPPMNPQDGEHIYIIDYKVWKPIHPVIHSAVPCASPQYPSHPLHSSRRASMGGDHAGTTPAKQSAYRTKPCRYDQVGYCRSGAECPFKHGDLRGEINQMLLSQIWRSQ